MPYPRANKDNQIPTPCPRPPPPPPSPPPAGITLIGALTGDPETTGEWGRVRKRGRARAREATYDEEGPV